MSDVKLVNIKKIYPVTEPKKKRSLFGKKDENDNFIILNPKIGKTECCLRDYNVKSGDTLEVIMDPIAG